MKTWSCSAYFEAVEYYAYSHEQLIALFMRQEYNIAYTVNGTIYAAILYWTYTVNSTIYAAKKTFIS